MAYAGLILDFGGVITTSLSGELEAFCIRERLPPDMFARALREDPEGRAAFEGVERGSVPQRDFEVTIARILGVDDRGMLARALGGLRERPGVLSLARRARSVGVRTACLSNTWGEGEFDPYAGWDLGGKFDAVVMSGGGLRKPDQEIYEMTAGKLGVSTRECVFADDTAVNLAPARALGMAAVHFTKDEDVEEIARLLGLPGV